MNELEAAWAAGLFEGEGWLYLGNARRPGNGSVTVGVGMTDKDVVDKLDSIWPAKRYVREVRGTMTKPLYLWQANGIVAYEFIKQIEKHLGARRGTKAREFIKIYENRKPCRPSQEKTKELVFNLTNEGLSRKEIAEKIGITENYVSALRKGALVN